MAGQRPQVEGEEHPVFEHVVGGELPLSPDEARRWLDQPGAGEDSGPIQGVCRLFGGAPENAVWLRFGRSVLGIALDLAGVGAETKVAMPSYQCKVVFDKTLSRCASLLFYQLRADLAPDEEGILDAARHASAVVTCAYFGSAGLDDRLAALGRRLRSLANDPWIIEDRAMAFPAPVSAADAAARCDFLMYSLRKSYPVPDGAPLVACSERAREALSTWRARASGPAPDEPEGPLRVKVLAKVKRHAWVTSRPLVDDPDLNGLRESVASESLISAMDADNRADARAGSRASAAYILARDLARDGRTVRDRSRAFVEALHHTLRGTFPLHDCTGIAVPVLLDGRRDFLANGRAQGIFLPVHWPRDESVPLGADVRRWYEAEIGLPTLPASPPEDVDYLIRRLATLQ